MSAAVAGPIERGNGIRIDGEVIADVGEPHGGAAAEDRVDGCGERERGGDHLLTGTNVEDMEGGVERHGAVGDRDRVCGAGHRCAERLEALHHRPLCEMAAAEHGEHERFDLRAELWRGDADAFERRGLRGAHDVATSRTPCVARPSSASCRRRANSPAAIFVESRNGETVERPDAV